jgi:S-adenosylmethionine:tRNA ribosyltransferase-isomerase
VQSSELDYNLPSRLIAQHPVLPRDKSRLLIYDRSSGAITHGLLPDLLSHIDPGDVLVFNDSRVLMARVGAFRPTGGKAELLFLRRKQSHVWEALVKPSSRLREGMRLSIDDDGAAMIKGIEGRDIFELIEHVGAGRWLVRNHSGLVMEELLESIGHVPLPPYIKEELDDPERYQTIYAERTGSAAAPTAGLHFTPALIEQLKGRGVTLAPVTLHIGLDTFRPVEEGDLDLHEIHREHYQMPPETRDAINKAHADSGKVIAVGTTTVRVLETVFGDPAAALEGDTGLFITPGFEFKAVDAILTNFHLPRSTLLALVMSFSGVDEIQRLYREAIQEEYRFYSFGDAMLLL